MSIESHRHPFQAQHVAPAGWCIQELELHLPGAPRPVDPLLRVEEPLEAALLDHGPAGDALGDLARGKVDGPQLDRLGVALLGVEGALQVGDEVLLILVGGPVPGPLPLLNLDIIRVVAGIGGHGAAEGVHVQNGARCAVQKGSVVGHDQHRAIEPLQEALQPFQGRDIQVVCRFVEEEQVGVGEQQPGQAQARLFAPAQVVDGCLLV